MPAVLQVAMTKLNYTRENCSSSGYVKTIYDTKDNRYRIRITTPFGSFDVIEESPKTSLIAELSDPKKKMVYFEATAASN